MVDSFSSAFLPLGVALALFSGLTDMDALTLSTTDLVARGRRAVCAGFAGALVASAAALLAL